VERIYGAIAAFSDTFFNAILESVTRDLTKLDVINFLRKISSSLFGVLMILPHMFDFTPKFYDVLTIKIPSILKSLKIIFELKPEEVVVSTPGPVGLIGLLAARLMSVKLKIIYHSDFAKQIGSMIQDEPTNPVVDAYQRWFHNLADEILVPTRRYIDILEGRGFDPAKLKLFRRGIDISQYFFRESGTRW
jgi:hypothetical protein